MRNWLAMNRFLRFLEARGHARIPRWWEDLMRNAKVTSRESFGFGWQDQKFDYRPTLDLNGKSIKSRITFEGRVPPGCSYPHLERMKTRMPLPAFRMQWAMRLVESVRVASSSYLG